MSWQAYADYLRTDNKDEPTNDVVGAALGFGVSWAAESGIKISNDEWAGITAKFANPNNGAGFTVGGVKYMALACEDTILRGRKGANAITIFNTGKCHVVGVMGEGGAPGNNGKTVEEMGKDLKEKGF